MAGVNLVKRLKEYKSGGPGGAKPKRSGLNLNFSVGGGADVSSRDKVLLVLFLIGAGLGYYATMYEKEYVARIENEKRAEISALDAKIATERTKMQALKSLAQEADAYEKQMADLRRKLQTVESLGKNRNLAVRMVDFIVSEMPKNVWLSKMTLDTRMESKVEVSGSAMTLQVVSEFMKRLEGAVFFPSWTLVETQKQDTAMNAAGGSATQNKNTVPDARSFLLNARVVPL